MSAFGGKADMPVCESPLSRSLLGVKRTCLSALHMSAFDPKRTSAVQNPCIAADDHLVCYRLIRQTRLARSLDALRVELCSMVGGASSSHFLVAQQRHGHLGHARSNPSRYGGSVCS